MESKEARGKLFIKNICIGAQSEKEGEGEGVIVEERPGYELRSWWRRGLEKSGVIVEERAGRELESMWRRELEES